MESIFKNEEEAIFMEPPNPLLIHTVIKEVSHYLTPPDLRVCRLVCKQWDEELSKLWRKVFQLRLLNDEALRTFLSSSILNHAFCSNYLIGHEVTLDNSTLFRTFFGLYGPFIKSLCLSNCKWSKGDLFSILYQYCPNLVEFSVLGDGVHEGLFLEERDQMGCVPPVMNVKCLRVNLICTPMIRNTKLMGDLLRMLPNLEVLSWIESYYDEIRYDRNFQLEFERAWQAERSEDGTTIRDTITDIAIHRKNIKLSKLTRIESNIRLNNESIQVLEGRGFPLKFLDLSLTSDVQCNVLMSLLHSLSGSLETLRLEFYPTHGCTTFFDFDFPRMIKLEHLFVQKFPSYYSMSRNFNAKKLPCLKSLTFCETDFKRLVENEEIDRGIAGSNGSIRILQITCDLSRFHLTNYGIEKLSKLFPNLREARMENFDKLEKTIWEKCFKLLRYFESPSDRGLGGLPSPKGEKECSKCCKHFVKGLYQR